VQMVLSNGPESLFAAFSASFLVRNDSHSSYFVSLQGSNFFRCH